MLELAPKCFNFFTLSDSSARKIRAPGVNGRHLYNKFVTINVS